MQYKLQLQTLKKGSLCMKEYFEQDENLIDTLAASGYPLSEDDQILHVLGGLGLDYDAVVVHVTSRVDSLLLSDVAALLFAHEGRIDSYTNLIDSSSPSVNATTFQQTSKPFSRPPTAGSFSRGRGRGRNFRGGRRGWSHNSGRPVCQICGITGHIAEKCYYRIDQTLFILDVHLATLHSLLHTTFFSISIPVPCCCSCFLTN